MMHIADPARAGEISAAIDALFANSPVVTRTQTEHDFAQGRWPNWAISISLLI